MDLKERIELTRQTLDALERVEANKGKVPDGFVLEYYETTNRKWEWSALNAGSEQRLVMYYRLRSATPRQIPLDPKDIPPLSVVRHPNWMAPDSWAFVSCVAANSPEVYISASTRISRSLDQLMSEGWLIKRQSDTEWQPCSKDAAK